MDDPSLAAYQLGQTEIETRNPYVTDTVIYTPQTRKGFYRFIMDNYASTFQLIPHVKGPPDEDACAKLEQEEGKQVEAFLYQKFIREYIRNAGPYRGILVYHGLGSGKTCSAIAAAEALYGTSNKRIIVMTPFSLRNNFMSEISFCGFRHFNLFNHWIPMELTKGSTVYTYAETILSLKPSFLNKVMARQDGPIESGGRRFVWVADFNASHNYNKETFAKQYFVTYDPNQFPEKYQQDLVKAQACLDDVREQISQTIDSRFTFISYNGITAAKLMKMACETDPATGERQFDNAVIVIDEVHNLTRLMQGEIMPYIAERQGGRKRKIEVEPIVPGKWVPKLCGKSEKYKRAYLFYKLLTDARNSKIIGLSGTPIINFPEELGIMANVLAGYTECVEFSLSSTDTRVMQQVKKIAEQELRVDIVRFREGNQQMGVLISAFQEGYEAVRDASDQFVGVQAKEEAQDDIRAIYARIKEKLKAAAIPIGQETFVSYPRLPIDDETFKREFINPVDLTIANRMVLQKRLTGLISYYKGSKEEYMPRVTTDEIVQCEMSDYLLEKYTEVRKNEIEGEVGKKKEKGDAYAAVEMFSKMKNPSSYRFRSRALCNFAFPKDITRPFPGDGKRGLEALKEMEAEVEDVEEDVMEKVAELSPEEAAIAEEELKEVEREEAAIEEEEEEEEKEQQGGGSESDSESESEEENGGGEYDDMSGGAGEERAVMKRPVIKKAAAEAADAAVPSVIPSAAPSVIPSVIPSAAPSAVPSAEPSMLNSIKQSVGALFSAPSKQQPRIPQASEARQASEAPIAGPSYQKRIEMAMKELHDTRDKYLQLDAVGGLSTYSPKLDHMLRRIQKSKGSNLVYSQFKTVEGLGVLGIALKANGYTELEIVYDKASGKPAFSASTMESLQKGPLSDEQVSQLTEDPFSDVRSLITKRFISFTGEGSKEHRALVLNIFNGRFDKLPAEMRAILEPLYSKRANTLGEMCWVIGITGAGAEGISLKCCRSVHIMEPYWNNVRLDQVKGRAIRICSHKDLPFKERTVDIYTYYTVFSKEQKIKNKIDMSIRTSDNSKTSDENVYEVSVKKDKVNGEILKIMQESAVDCSLNAADNEGVQCVAIEGRPDKYLFDPNLEYDKLITSIEYTEKKAKVETSTKRPGMRQIQIVEIGGIQYMTYPTPGAGGALLDIYARTDQEMKKKLGEIELDAVTGTMMRYRLSSGETSAASATPSTAAMTSTLPQ